MISIDTNNYFKYTLCALVAVYILGIGIHIMDIDAAQYAEMSREMSITNSYLQVYELGNDYLDKPPFLFWMSALSVKLFGANNLGYRLPSMVFGLLALYSTYKFALVYYKREIALLAVLILASSQAFFLMMHDVRTDTILMCWVIYSIWQLALWFTTGKAKHLILGCIAVGCGMLTKGPIALIVPVVAFGSHFVVTRSLHKLLKWQHLLGIMCIAIVLVPMSIGLYEQYDLQPNKLVNGKTGVSGLRFFYWTQSFGRITGESVWDNGATIFFLAQNMLWAFLPWIVIFIIALVYEMILIIKLKGKLPVQAEWICVGGFLLSYIALGSSKYQLPHYIFVVLPFAAIITAKLCNQLNVAQGNRKLVASIEKSHFVLFLLLIIVLGLLLCVSFETAIGIRLAYILYLIGYLYVFLQKKIDKYFIKLCIYTIIGVNFFLNISIYPSLLQYQLGSRVGIYVNNNEQLKGCTYIYQDHIFPSLHYYAKQIILHKDSVAQYVAGDYAIIPTNKISEFTSKGIIIDTVMQLQTYNVTKLSLKFLNPNTRTRVTTPYAIISIK